MKTPRLLFEPTILLEALLAPSGDSGQLLRRCLEIEGSHLLSTPAAVNVVERASRSEELLEAAGLTEPEVARWVAALELRLSLIEVSETELDSAAARYGDPWERLSEVDQQCIAAALDADCLLVTRDPGLAELLGEGGEVVVQASTPAVVLDLLDALRGAG